MATLILKENNTTKRKDIINFIKNKIPDDVYEYIISFVSPNRISKRQYNICMSLYLDIIK